ncbi:hypothetical protein D3C76_1741100 [compost metagenome]
MFVLGPGQVVDAQMGGKFPHLGTIGIVTQMDMYFGTVRIIHIETAVNRFEEKGSGFIVGRNKDIHIRI